MSEDIKATENVTTTPATETKSAPETKAAPAADAKAPESKSAEVTPKAAADESKAQPPKAEPKEAAQGESKPDDKPVAPEKYELKLSKDSLLDASYIAKIEADAKAQGLSNEQAQALLSRDEQLNAQFFQRQQEQIKQQQKLWVSEVENDKEIGGKNLKENLEVAKRALNKFSDPSFMKILDETGLGNNPHLIRMLNRVGKAMTEDRLVTDGKAGTAPREKKSTESKLYPNMKTTQE